MKQLCMTALLTVMIAGLLSAGDGQKFDRSLLKMKKVVEVEKTSEGQSHSHIPMVLGSSIFIDSSVNAYTSQSSYTGQCYYDVASNSYVITHRGSPGYGSSSGRIHYNYSTDGGVTWYRSSAVNEAASAKNARHPSIIIANDGATAFPVGMWGELVGGAFGGLGTWYDILVGADLSTTTLDLDVGATAFSVPDAPFTANGKVFASVQENNGAGYWLIQSTDAGATFFGAEDGTYFIDTTIAVDINGAFGDFGPDGLYGVVAIEAIPKGAENYEFGYRKTTDGGETWLPFQWVLKSSITGIPANAHTLMFQNDVSIDINNNIYFIGTYVDTSSVSPQHNICLISNRGGSWNAQVIANPVNYNFPWLAGLSSRNECGLARSEDGHYITATWIDGVVEAGVTTSTDVYCRVYNTVSGNWKPAINMTDDNNAVPKFTKLAPRLKEIDANTYAVAMSYFLFGGADKTDPGLTSYMYMLTQDVTVGVNENDNKASTFALSQNFPNPFNPNTNIKYTLGANANVTLKIYNMLGQEVRTLVNGAAQLANTPYAVNWDGKDNSGSAVASGIYMYRLEAGNYVKTMKMTLLK